MKRFKRSCTAWLLALAMVLSLLPTAALAADEEETLTPAASSNTGDQSYTIYYASTVKSYLTETNSGLMRVEYIDGQVVVEYYDSDYTLTGTKTIECELTTFGGFYAGEDAYYLVFGQSNTDEDNSVEVIRVVKYSTDWVRLGQASLYGANTYIPFDAGSCRMTEYGGYLYIRTCHEMYASTDGLHHQANMMVVVQESSMEITGSQYSVWNNSVGYVSHSFNQFILVDDNGKIIALDHGDAYPRAAILFRYTSSAGSATFSTSNSNVSLLSFQGTTGQNYTGASLGGLEYSSTSYLTVGNSVTQDDNWSSHTARNVFVTVTDRDNFASSGTTVNWITDYDDDGSTTASTPQLVKLDSDSFLLLWTTTEYLDSSTSYSKQTKLHYVYLDGEGNTVGDIHTVDGQLSDCQPIVSNGSVVWYVTGDANGTSTATTPYFYSIDADGTFHVQAELSAPSVSVSAVTGGLQVSWDAVDGAEGYYVCCASGSSRSSKTVEGGDTTSATFTISGTSCKTYTVWVEAYSGSSKSLAQNKVEFFYVPSPTLTLTNTASGVQLSWSAITGAETYKIYRKTADGDYALLGTTEDSSWTDSTADSGTAYTYQVYALSGETSSGGSTEKTATWLAAPTLLSVENTSDGVQVTWSTVDGAATYRIYCEDTSSWYYVAAGSGATQSVTIRLTNGTTYSISVAAYANGSLSAASESITILAEEVHTHSYTSAVTKAATCGEDGVRTYTCSCGDSYTETIPATGNHTAGSAVQENVVAATATTNGSYDNVVYCAVCGKEISRETVTIPATGDSGDSGDTGTGDTGTGDTGTGDTGTGDTGTGDTGTGDSGTGDTGTGDTGTGDTGTGDTGTGDTGTTHTHAYTSAVTKAATCTDTGVRTYTCSCGASYTESIPATGHTAGETVRENVVEATAATNGSYDNVVYCAACGAQLSRETVTVPATGSEDHTHSWTGTVTTAATCTTDGVTTYTCSCGASYTESIPATGHTWDEGTVTLAATRVTQGEVTYTCTACGETKTETIAALTAATFLFDDVKDSTAWYYDAVYWAYDLEITKGYDDGVTQTFKPNNNCTRAEFATFLYTLARAYGLENAGDTASKSFTDVAESGWYYDYVMWAAENGIVSGYTDGTFKPNSQITRAEAVTMLYSFYKFFVNGGEDPAVTGESGSAFSDLSSTAWYYTYMAWAVENGVVSGYPDGTCRPNTNCTRSVMVVLLYATANHLL